MLENIKLVKLFFIYVLVHLLWCSKRMFTLFHSIESEVKVVLTI